MPKMTIPFVDMASQFRNLESELTKAFIDIGRGGVYIMGDRLESFEAKAAKFCDVNHAIGVGHGSDALFLILKALDIGPGDEVITATNSFIASAWVVVATGAKPVLVDVAEDLNIEPNLIDAAITSKTKAIMPVHLTGRPARMDEINLLAQRKGLYVIEDAAQAIGARYRGSRVGSLGLAAGFSLHPLKNLGVYGDGGLITTNDDKLASKLRKLRNHGLRNRDECELWGFNSRLDTLQAAFAEIKLGYLDNWNERCREIAASYRSDLENVVQVPFDKEWEECVYHNFVIRVEQRDELMAYLLEHGVDTRIHYPIPIHLQEAAKNLGYKIGSFPKAEKYAKTMISLPIYPDLCDNQVNYITRLVNSFFNEKWEK
jgi:dTDP-4-amino-4,6-dideoxygalactose transaminase